MLESWSYYNHGYSFIPALLTWCSVTMGIRLVSAQYSVRTDPAVKHTFLLSRYLHTEPCGLNWTADCFCKCLIFFNELQLVYTISGVQQNDSVIHILIYNICLYIYIYLLFFNISSFIGYYRIYKYIRYSSLCYTVGPCYLFYI